MRQSARATAVFARRMLAILAVMVMLLTRALAHHGASFGSLQGGGWSPPRFNPGPAFRPSSPGFSGGGFQPRPEFAQQPFRPAPAFTPPMQMMNANPEQNMFVSPRQNFQPPMGGPIGQPGFQPQPGMNPSQSNIRPTPTFPQAVNTNPYGMQNPRQFNPGVVNPVRPTMSSYQPSQQPLVRPAQPIRPVTAATPVRVSPVVPVRPSGMTNQMTGSTPYRPSPFVSGVNRANHPIHWVGPPRQNAAISAKTNQPTFAQSGTGLGLTSVGRPGPLPMLVHKGTQSVQLNTHAGVSHPPAGGHGGGGQSGRPKGSATPVRPVEPIHGIDSDLKQAKHSSNATTHPAIAIHKSTNPNKTVAHADQTRYQSAHGVYHTGSSGTMLDSTRLNAHTQSHGKLSPVQQMAVLRKKTTLSNGSTSSSSVTRPKSGGSSSQLVQNTNAHNINLILKQQHAAHLDHDINSHLDSHKYGHNKSTGLSGDGGKIAKTFSSSKGDSTKSAVNHSSTHSTAKTTSPKKSQQTAHAGDSARPDANRPGEGTGTRPKKGKSGTDNLFAQNGGTSTKSHSSEGKVGSNGKPGPGKDGKTLTGTGGGKSGVGAGKSQNASNTGGSTQKSSAGGGSTILVKNNSTTKVNTSSNGKTSSKATSAASGGDLLGKKKKGKGGGGASTQTTVTNAKGSGKGNNPKGTTNASNPKKVNPGGVNGTLTSTSGSVTVNTTSAGVGGSAGTAALSGWLGIMNSLFNSSLFSGLGGGGGGDNGSGSGGDGGSGGGGDGGGGGADGGGMSGDGGSGDPSGDPVLNGDAGGDGQDPSQDPNAGTDPAGQDGQSGDDGQGPDATPQGGAGAFQNDGADGATELPADTDSRSAGGMPGQPADDGGQPVDPSAGTAVADWAGAAAEFVAANPGAYAGNVVGDGASESFVREAAGAPDASNWRQGTQVMGNMIAPGTAIATFDAGGNYIDGSNGGDAAIYEGQDGAGLWVLDQSNGGPVSRRYIPFASGQANPRDDGSAYRTIVH